MKKLLGYTLFAGLCLLIGMLLADKNIGDVAKTTAKNARSKAIDVVASRVEDWVVALQEMASLEPKILLPAHGEPIMDTATIVENFSVLAEALQHIVNHTIDGLNAGKRKDQIFRTVQLPEHLATHPTLNVQYVTRNDISKMVIKKYTGWWDDIPSHWTPAPIEDQGEMMNEAAGRDGDRTRGGS